MRSRTATLLSVTIIVAIAIVNVYAVERDLYFYFPWLDIPMHIIGSFWVGFTALAIIQWKGGRSMPLKERFSYALLIAFGVGVVWELFELLSDVSFALEPYVYDPIDTCKDLLDDVVGGAVAGIVGYIHQHHEERP